MAKPRLLDARKRVYRLADEFRGTKVTPHSLATLFCCASSSTSAAQLRNFCSLAKKTGGISCAGVEITRTEEERTGHSRSVADDIEHLLSDHSLWTGATSNPSAATSEEASPAIESVLSQLSRFFNARNSVAALLDPGEDGAEFLHSEENNSGLYASESLVSLFRDATRAKDDSLAFTFWQKAQGSTTRRFLRPGDYDLDTSGEGRVFVSELHDMVQYGDVWLLSDFVARDQELPASTTSPPRPARNKDAGGPPACEDVLTNPPFLALFDEVSGDGETAVVLAARLGELSTLHALVKLAPGAVLAQPDYLAQTLLHHVARWNLEWHLRTEIAAGVHNQILNEGRREEELLGKARTTPAKGDGAGDGGDSQPSLLRRRA
eukprot:g14124.t1